MNPINHHDILRCPKCKGKLLWDQHRCSECDRAFQVDDGILDFISYAAINEQNRFQIELHKSLVTEYERRYEPVYAKIYSDYWNKQFLSHMPQDTRLILDNGCGTGDLIRALLPYGPLLIGADISKAMIRQGKYLIGEKKNIIWVVSPGESLPFADKIFDVICFRGALHHMANEVLALKEAFRVLKGGGLIMLSEPNDDSILLRAPRKMANRRIARFGVNHKAFRSKRWLRIIEEIGFSVKHTKYFSFLSQPLCGMSDLIPLLKILPFSRAIAKALVRFDETASKLPFIKKQSFDLFVVARKEE